MSFQWSCVDAIQIEIGYTTQTFWEGWASVSVFFTWQKKLKKATTQQPEDYDKKTMRDGGNDAWNMSSSYLDIQFFFYRAIDLCTSKSATLESYRKLYGKTKTYLEICREPFPEPELDYLRAQDMFRGMHFVILGKYGHLKETQASLDQMEEMLFPM